MSMTTTKAPNKGIARAHKERKRAEAVARQEAHASLSNQEKLDKLIARGHESCAEAVALFEHLNPPLVIH